MNITDWDNAEIVRVLLAHNKMTQKQLIKLLEEKTRVEIPQSTFANRLWRNSMRVRELQQICDILGYDIILKQRK